MASLPWSIFIFSGFTGDTPGWGRLDDFLEVRLENLDPVLAEREWLAGTFSVADSSWQTYCASSIGSTGISPAVTTSPAPPHGRPFAKAHAHQMAHFAAAD